MFQAAGASVPSPQSAAAQVPDPAAAAPMAQARHYQWVREEDRDPLEAALQQAGGNQARAARAMGLTARQFSYRLRKLREPRAPG